MASKAGDLVLRATTRRLVFEGYQAAYATSFFRKPQSSDEEDDQEDSQASLLASGFPDLKVALLLQHPQGGHAVLRITLEYDIFVSQSRVPR